MCVKERERKREGGEKVSLHIDVMKYLYCKIKYILVHMCKTNYTSSSDGCNSPFTVQFILINCESVLREEQCLLFGHY